MTREQDKGRARQAKGSVRDAIGKIIGDPVGAQQGIRDSETTARNAGDQTAKDGRD